MKMAIQLDFFNFHKLDWKQSEIDKRTLVESGQAVVANQRNEPHLVAWAKKCGVYVNIAGPGVWGNPFSIPRDGDRVTVIKKYHQHLMREPNLLERILELKGKVLGCWCAPFACHGDVLISFLEVELWN
jgi:hypothetical protein